MEAARVAVITVSLSLMCSSFLLAGGPKGRGPEGADKAMYDEMIGRYDKNGDGKLDEKEQAAMKAARALKKADQDAKMLAEFDKDGDGKLSEEEMAVARTVLAERRAAHMKMLLQKFDKDGDGKLNDDEKLEARKWEIAHKEDVDSKGKGDGAGPKDRAKPAAVTPAGK